MKKPFVSVLAAALLAAASVPVSALSLAPAAAQKAAPAARAEGVWIDVRSPEEYAAGHLSDAQNIPLEQLVARAAEVQPDKTAPVNLYCKSGRRAGLAKQMLEKLGYTNVRNQGGYQDLLAKGLK
ncbi:Thiosulfate sulfurtransferase PspE precursor [Kingella potus]|uniref:Thiosulfate sulfurtransferase PspE n=1 Tax=Kingella potus TaxID=265175 RepID=A0A377R1Q7_9NEIS|nr:rhodanese-like domain-containing protein [Kingella potus]UOP00738.1 rhodanese-like domain-containing protein [Kingella potus]STR02858.1 Thiosulfate sulfurtransferase PspE precursor [Kingella potus]